MFIFQTFKDKIICEENFSRLFESFPFISFYYYFKILYLIRKNEWSHVYNDAKSMKGKKIHLHLDHATLNAPGAIATFSVYTLSP